MDYRLSRDQLVSWGFPAYAEGNRMLPSSQRYMNGLGTLRSGDFRGSLGLLPPAASDRGLVQGRALMMGAMRGSGDEGLAIALGARMAGADPAIAIAHRGRRAIAGLGSTRGQRTCDVVGGLLNAGASVASMFGGSVTTDAQKSRAQTAEKAGTALTAGGTVVDTICDARFQTNNQASGDVTGADLGPAGSPPVEQAGVSTNTLVLAGLGVLAIGALLVLGRR